MKAKRVRFDIRRQGLPILIVLLAVLAVNALGWLVLVRPKAAEYAERTVGGESEQRKLLAEYRDSVVAAEAYVAGLAQNEKDWRYLRTEVLSSRSERLVEIQQELARLCAEFRIDIDTVQVTNQVLREDGLDRFAMVVPLEGDYDDLRKFLQAVEASDEFMVIERVALAGALRGGGSGLQLSITLASYFDLLPDSGRANRGAGDA
jgi:Tfp pilus assembly protein PilO